MNKQNIDIINKSKIDILLIEDNPTDAHIIQQILLRNSEDRWQITHVNCLEKGINICYQIQPENIKSSSISINYQLVFHVILLDLNLPDSKGLDTLKKFMGRVPHIPVVVLTNLDNEEIGLQAMMEGAQDYLVKEKITINQLIKSTLYAVERGENLKKIIEKQELLHQELVRQQEINQLRHNFVAMLSHEFRAPMTTIQTSVDILEHQGEKNNPELKTKHFRRVHNALERMVRMLDDILFLYKSEVNKVEFIPKVLNLEKFCQEITEIIRLSGNDKPSIILDFQVSQNQVKMDEELLTCIITNLLSNAVKYSPQEGEIYFRISSDRDAVIFRIEDQGIGIPFKEQEKLFDTFYRASNIGTVRGTGLGLAIVKRCVELHQGRIEFESQEGLGTVFTVIFPM